MKNINPPEIKKRSSILFTVSVRVLLVALLLNAKAFSQSLQVLQDNFLTLKYGAFLHFNMGTFTNEEWATPGQNPNLFNPINLNCGQWADAAVAAGMKYMTLTTKHHDGFCLWNSAYTAYDVGSSSWKGGKGDVVREFVDSLRSRNIKICLYYSIWDKTNGSDTTFIKNQLTELLTQYGAIDALWFDGWGWHVGYSAVPYKAIYNHIKSLQPNCLVLENNHSKSLTNTDIMIYERNIDGIPPLSNTIPTEACDNIRNDGNWFYHEAGNCSLKSLAVLRTSLNGLNAAHGNYLLDLTPDRDGLVPACQVAQLTQLKAYNAPLDTGLINQDKARFYGSWKNSGSRGFGDYTDDVQFTQTPGDSFTFEFNGAGISLLTELNGDHGAFDIYLDGAFVKRVSCIAQDTNRLAQMVVFSSLNLTKGAHKLKGVFAAGTGTYGVVDAFKIYPDVVVSVQKQPVLSPASLEGIQFSRGQRIVFPTIGTWQIYSVSGKGETPLHGGVNRSFLVPNLPAGIYIIQFKGISGSSLNKRVALW